jgi:soluble lytic murein transglycosylase-like protein
MDVNAEALASTNQLRVDSKLRKGQRLRLPLVNPGSPQSVPTDGVVIGKRILFKDGSKLDVNQVWKQGDTVWYQLNGTSQSVTREIKSIEDRYTETSNAAVRPQAITKPADAPKATPSPTTWIYLVDGARIRVDEVRESNDGAWYKRDNLTIFLARERIGRIERDVVDGTVEDSNVRGWSSGNGSIDQLIRKHATRVGVDPYLVFLVVEQESHFRPRIVSPKGAMGLMQLMPGTARRFGVTRPFDPAENIRGGTQYLKQLLTMFGGRVDLALASYNAGEGRVLDYGNRVPPFKETREYVKRISARYSKKKPEREASNQ